MRMKYARLLLVCTLYLAGAVRANSQTPPPSVDQVLLAKQFVGLWQLDLPNDTTFFLQQDAYGDTAFVLTTWYAGKSGARIREGHRVYGYDVTADRYVGAAIGNSRSRMSMYVLWFTSDRRCEGYNYRDVFNPSGSITRRFVIEFTSSDEWVQTNTYPDNRPSDTELLRRVKR